MKHIIGVLAVGLLVGCTATEPINGTYIIDAEYSSSHMPEVARSQGIHIDNQEDYIKGAKQVMEFGDTVTEVDYPSWRRIRTKPSEFEITWQLKKPTRTSTLCWMKTTERFL